MLLDPRRIGSALAREVLGGSHREKVRVGAVAAPGYARDRGVRGPVGPGQHSRPEAVPEEGPHRAPVRDDDDTGALRVTGAYLIQRRLEAGHYLFVGLGAGERPALLFRQGEELLGELRVALFLIGPGVALEDAAVAFDQAAHRDDLAGEAGLARDDLGGLEGPGERAAVDGVVIRTRQRPSGQGGLTASLLGEGKLHLALPDPVRVRRGLSVAHQ